MTKTEIVKKKRLKPKQELFCQLYIGDEEFFGNGVKSYMKAYPNSSYDTAKSNAQKWLTKTYILDRINELMDIVINNTVVDKELAFVIKQKENLHAKVQAIREWNNVKKRTVPVIIPIQINVYEKLSDEELIEKARKRGIDISFTS